MFPCSASHAGDSGTMHRARIPLSARKAVTPPENRVRKAAKKIVFL